MMTIETGTQSLRPSHAPRDADRVNACWPCVRVDSVQVVPTDVSTRVRTIVQLGGLTPADVRVELMPAEGAHTSPADPWEQRWMFSSHSLANGCFAFEATLPHRDSAERREWLIHVHPIEALEEPRVEHRFLH